MNTTSQSQTEISQEQASELIQVLKSRFEKNMNRHENISWKNVQAKLEGKADKLWSLYEMERTGGEPDVVVQTDNTYTFVDCSAESPKGRRSICYDRAALDSRKENKPASNALEMAANMGIQILNEEQYRHLQQFGAFDTKTSSWIETPPEIRILGGALFCDRRYNTVFTYHNGAESYYAARGFRGLLHI